ncbi:DNA recombination protein RmuC [Spiroplasma taiwanense]|uniref:DNA recombination protein RmuC n=1 Tax=Spiroplasma taiwanense CT-1 TaxID=1276220 RepID=S5LZZ9_9MOLU|nr:DNA recombination protein RmuC [Spiroplasma taiwanense]AGR41322.1 hypothetical protein STAIW_v1c07080 [Spiroplasma taiwanense CT-1]
MEITLLILVIILISVVIILSIVFLLKKSNLKVEGVSKVELELLQSQIENLNIRSSEELKNFMNEINNKSSEKLTNFEKIVKEEFYNSNIKETKKIISLEKEVKNWIESQTKHTEEKLDNSNREVRNLLNTVKDQSTPIFEVKEKIYKLDNLLSQNNKAGKSGEYFLERIFENLAGINKNNNLLFERQYTMKKKDEQDKNLKPDLFIKGEGQKFVNIPIDSKFSFNAYLDIQNLDNNSEVYQNNIKKFKADIKARIKETSKYISEEDNTVYSIMFIPSEGIFSFLSSFAELIDEGFKNKVIIAGRSKLVGIISSVDHYMNLFDNINQADKKIKILGKVIKYMKNYDQQIQSLFKTIENLIENFNALKVKESSLTNMYNKLLKTQE